MNDEGFTVMVFNAPHSGHIIMSSDSTVDQHAFEFCSRKKPEVRSYSVLRELFILYK
jgi:hypothetical protein